MKIFWQKQPDFDSDSLVKHLISDLREEFNFFIEKQAVSCDFFPNFSIFAHISRSCWAKDFKPVPFDRSHYFLSKTIWTVSVAYQEP